MYTVVVVCYNLPFLHFRERSFDFLVLSAASCCVVHGQLPFHPVCQLWRRESESVKRAEYSISSTMDSAPSYFFCSSASITLQGGLMLRRCPFVIKALFVLQKLSLAIDARGRVSFRVIRCGNKVPCRRLKGLFELLSLNFLQAARFLLP